MTAFAIGLCGFVARGDGSRQVDRVVAFESKYGDEKQRHNSTRERHPAPAPMQVIGDSFELQLESLGH
jgi:hypothetical protein